MLDSRIEAMIFDCDGTLVDSLPIGTEVLTAHLTSLDIVLSHAEVADRFGSGRLAEAIADLERSLGRALPADFVTEFRRRRDLAVRNRLRPMDGALELVSGLRMPIAVASNGPLAQTLLSLEVTGLLRFFSGNVFSAYEIGSFKPAPALLIHAANSLGVDPARCAVVEDASLGVEAGIAAGMTVFALCDDEGWDPNRVFTVRSLRDVGRHLNGNPI